MKSSFSKTKYLNALSRFSMLDGGTSILVGFSGGVDSSLLLTLLSQTDGLTVAAAHLNHGIRGEEAMRDEYFCRRFCAENNITLYTKRVDIPKISEESGLGLEEAARNARYTFFGDICREHGYDLIATAHNADDNVETVLFHLIRGTGIDGLCGIPPVRGNVIRPLILYSKDEIIEGCREYSIPYVTDSTNFDSAYTRNYLRNEIIPKLKRINTSLCDNVNGTIELLKNDSSYLSELSREHSINEGRRALSALPNPIISRVLINKMKELDITIERERVSEMIMAIRSRSAHISVSLNGYTFVCDRDLIYLIKERNDTAFCFPLKIGLNIINEESALYVYSSSDDSENEINKLKNIYNLSIQAEISSDTIDEMTVVRSRNNGDLYRQGAMTRKVKKMIQSLKLPKAVTDSIPFIVRGEEILYIPFFKPADAAFPTDNEKKFTVIYFSKGNEE